METASNEALRVFWYVKIITIDGKFLGYLTKTNSLSTESSLPVLFCSESVDVAEARAIRYVTGRLSSDGVPMAYMLMRHKERAR